MIYFFLVSRGIYSTTPTIKSALPTQGKWINSIWKTVVEQIHLTDFELQPLLVKTRPEMRDFSRQTGVFRWPTIEM